MLLLVAYGLDCPVLLKYCTLVLSNSFSISNQEKQEELEPLQVEYDRMKQTCVNQGKVIKEKMKELNEMHDLMVNFVVIGFSK